MARGTLTQNGVHLADHEYATVRLLLDQGNDITLIPPLQVKGANTPDISLNGVIWEMKSPTGDGKHTIKHNLQNAKKQSRNVIVDLRRCKLPDDRALKELEHHFQLSKRFRRMKVITKSAEILDFSK